MNLKEQLKMLRSQLECIESNWNGDESGVAEDRATSAYQAIAFIDELQDILIDLKII